MLARQRQERILEQVRLTGGARVGDLVELLGVSDMTVRRDIDVLARRGLVARVHGGATALTGRSAEEPGFAVKSALQTGEKAAIAVAAARLVEPGDRVGDLGRHDHLRRRPRAARRPGADRGDQLGAGRRVLHETGRDDLTVVLTGGYAHAVRRAGRDRSRWPRCAPARRLAVPRACTGSTSGPGFTTPNLVEAETNRALVTCARRVVVLADRTKWGVVGLSAIARLEDVDVLVTDDGLDPDARRA